MFKWILATFLVYAWVWFSISYTSAYPQISKQVDLKTLDIKRPNFIVKKWDKCVWTCENYSSSSSYWWGSYWGK